MRFSRSAIPDCIALNVEASARNSFAPLSRHRAVVATFLDAARGLHEGRDRPGRASSREQADANGSEQRDRADHEHRIAHVPIAAPWTVANALLHEH